MEEKCPPLKTIWENGVRGRVTENFPRMDTVIAIDFELTT